MKNLFDVSGKVALVTGGSRGIGEMIAEGYVAHGVRTYISSRKADVSAATAARLSAHGECISIPADLSTMDGVNFLVDQIREREDRLDVLVNNAGANWGEPIESFPESAWDKIMTTNVKSPVFLTQALLPLLKESASAEDPARIIMVGSIDGIIDSMGEKIVQGTPLKRAGKAEDMAGIAIYLASKAASFVTGVVIPVDGGLTGAKGTL